MESKLKGSDSLEEIENLHTMCIFCVHAMCLRCVGKLLFIFRKEKGRKHLSSTKPGSTKYLILLRYFLILSGQ